MDKKLTLKQLVTLVAGSSGVPQTEAHDFLSELTDIIQEGLERDGLVRIAGLGIFKLKWVETRTMRNIQTGEDMVVPGHNRIYFKPEKELRDFVNRRYAHLVPRLIGKPLPPPEQTEEQDNQNFEEQEVEVEKPGGAGKWIYAVLALLVLLVFLICAIGQKNGDRPSKPVAQAEQQEKARAQKPAAAEADKISSGTSTPEPAQQQPVESATAPAQKIDPAEVPMTGEHVVSAGENLWDLSKKYFKDAYLWPILLQANKETISDPDLLPVGTRIKVPELQGTEFRLTHDDSINIALGYEQAFYAYKQTGEQNAGDFKMVAETFQPE